MSLSEEIKLLTHRFTSTKFSKDVKNELIRSKKQWQGMISPTCATCSGEVTGEGTSRSMTVGLC